MKSIVYQQINPTFGMLLDDKPILFPDHFEITTEVDTDNLEVVFELTNLWPKDDPRLHIIKESRSTSVGDIVLTPDNHLHLCMPLGWYELDGRYYEGDSVFISNNLYGIDL